MPNRDAGDEGLGRETLQVIGQQTTEGFAATPSSEFPLTGSSGLDLPQLALNSPSGFQQLENVTAHVVRGRREVLSRRPLLERLAEEFQQPSAASQMEYFLTLPWTLKKIPHLVMLSLPPGRWAAAATHSWGPLAVASSAIQGAALVFEYAIRGIGTGVFATDDPSGVRTVFGPEEMRPQIARMAAEALLRRHAQIVLISCRTTYAHPEELPAAPSALVPGSCSAMQWRQVRDRLYLAETYEEVLAKLGRHTRRNLRYYRRRAEREIGLQFFSDVRGQISESEFQSLNRDSTHPSTTGEALRRYKSIQVLNNPVFSGLRKADGTWLSVAGGWHCGAETWIEWQFNRVGLEDLSISTVMRSYMLEALVERGTRTLSFIGGTPHSMSESFEVSWTMDVILRRQSLTADLVRGYARRIFRAENCLSQSLTDANLAWNTAA